MLIGKQRITASSNSRSWKHWLKLYSFFLCFFFAFSVYIHSENDNKGVLGVIASVVRIRKKRILFIYLLPKVCVVSFAWSNVEAKEIIYYTLLRNLTEVEFKRQARERYILVILEYKYVVWSFMSWLGKEKCEKIKGQR